MSIYLRVVAFVIGYIGTALALALLIRRFICAFAMVKGRSMMDTLLDREILLMLRYGVFGTPKRFDIVICRFPNRKGLFVKRIIGLPGETVSMEEDVIYINGAALEESFPRRKCLRKVEEFTLGQDAYFVMGDNRPSSSDSRRVGPLQRKQLLGRVIYVLFPLKRMRRVG